MPHNFSIHGHIKCDSDNDDTKNNICDGNDEEDDNYMLYEIYFLWKLFIVNI